MASQVDAGIPISSTPVVMLSPPDTQDGPQDVFHTPPEESLLPSSDVDVPHCTINQSVDLDAGSQAFVDLAGLSDSSEFVDFGKEIDADSGTENRSNGFRVLEKGVSDLGESPMKKLKLGFDSLGSSCSGVQSQKNEDGMGNCDEEKVEDVEMQNSVQEENVEPEVVQNAEDINLIIGNNSNNEIPEGSGMRENLEKATANGLGSETVKRRTEEEKKMFVFDVLRVLAENAKEKEKETERLTLLETARRSGITFPRPSWISPNYKSEIFKFDDEVEK